MKSFFYTFGQFERIQVGKCEAHFSPHTQTRTMHIIKTAVMFAKKVIHDFDVYLKKSQAKMLLHTKESSDSQFCQPK